MENAMTTKTKILTTTIRAGRNSGVASSAVLLWETMSRYCHPARRASECHALRYEHVPANFTST